MMTGNQAGRIIVDSAVRLYSAIHDDRYKEAVRQAYTDGMVEALRIIALMIIKERL